MLAFTQVEGLFVARGDGTGKRRVVAQDEGLISDVAWRP
jgi:hypothetical protein